MFARATKDIQSKRLWLKGFTTGATNSFGGANNKTNLAADFQTGPLGDYYYPASGGGLFTLVGCRQPDCLRRGLGMLIPSKTNQILDSNTVDIQLGAAFSW